LLVYRRAQSHSVAVNSSVTARPGARGAGRSRSRIEKAIEFFHSDAPRIRIVTVTGDKIDFVTRIGPKLLNCTKMNPLTVK
jgi:hypothetical protein